MPERSVVQQDTLCKVIYGTGKILNQIEVQTSHETFLGVLLVSHHIRRMSVYQSKVEAYLFLRQRSSILVMRSGFGNSFEWFSSSIYL